MSEDLSRKSFIQKAGSMIAGASLLPTVAYSLVPSSNKQRRPLGVALLGLGNYATTQLAPALQETHYCELRGIVTGTPSKIPKWQKKYAIPDGNVYNYNTLPEIATNEDIDVVYVVTPPALHAKYSIMAAEAGKHVWCEKPMAMNVEQCRSMIDTAERNGVKLAIGYRMQHEPNTRIIMEWSEEEPYGPITKVATGAGYSGSHDADSWRRDAEMGGGALYDMGVYCINGTRYATGLEPLVVSGKQYSERDIYQEVDETTEFEMKFPDKIMAQGITSFGKSVNYLEVNCRDGWYKLEPFQSYSGVKGMTSDGKKLPPHPVTQQALQMDNEALAILKERQPHVPGQEGLKDIRIIRAIMESSQQGGAPIEL